MPLPIAVLTGYTKTPAKRHNLFCFSTQTFAQDAVVYWLLVQQFQTDRKKSQALFIKDWFIDGNIPQNLQDGGFLSKCNAEDAVLKNIGEAVPKSIAATAFTRGGLMGALQTKIGGETKPPPKPVRQ